MDHRAPTTPPPLPIDTAIGALTTELRAYYAEAFRLAHRAAEAAQQRFETPDGNGPIDPVYAADTAACRAINRYLPTVVERYLPGARRIADAGEPAVVESRWLYQHTVVAIDVDYTHDFGDPNAITIRTHTMETAR